MAIKRISQDEYYLEMALTACKRSTCIRSMYGAVIVLNNRPLGFGYNGSPSGEINCTDIEKCAREGIESRTRYELCRALHAEDNAIGNAQQSVEGATIYISGMDGRSWHYQRKIVEKLGEGMFPCQMCYRRMIQRKIANVCIRDDESKPATFPLKAFAFLENPEWPNPLELRRGIVSDYKLGIELNSRGSW